MGQDEGAGAPVKISERTRKQLEGLPPEKRARALAVLARTQSPERRARDIAIRAILDAEYAATGRIATTGEEAGPFAAFLAELRFQRESAGLSLNDVAERSGIDKAQVSRLENGQQPNPTLATLARYAKALGKRVELRLVDGE